MPRKGVPLSEEQKAKMRAGRLAKKNGTAEQPVAPTEPTPETPSQEPVIPPADAQTLLIQQLIKQVDELKSQINPNVTPDDMLQANAQMQGQPITGKNGIQGRMFLYPIEPSYYPNPVDRLYDVPELKRHNLRDNYFLDWTVEGVEYEKYGITYAQPKFTVRLFRRLFDENDQPSGKYGLINRQVMHEDEVVARRAADVLGVTDLFANTRDMMDEMRFYRIKEWLLELFMPVKVTHHNRMPTQEVIGGKVVEVFDTEALIDGSVGHDKAAAIKSQTRI